MSLARTAPRALRRAPQRLRQAPPRRYASDASHDAHAHVDPAPASESFGTSFYLAVGLVPASIVVYSISRPAKNGEKNPVTKMLERYSDWRDTWTRRNELHTRMVEQAGHDRNLFINTPQPGWVDLRFPEMLQMGSPISVPAGHNVNLEHVMEHYRRRNEEEERQKLKKLDEKRRRVEETARKES